MTAIKIFASKYKAEAIAAYINALGTYKFPGEGLFPHKKQDGLKIGDIRTSKGAIKVLDMSHFDTLPLKRDRGGVKEFYEEMPLFREHIVLSEQDRQDLLDIILIGGQRLDSKMQLLNRDALELVNSAVIALEAMRMQLLFSGSLAFETEKTGISKVVDYGFDAATQHNSLSGTDAWDNPATANPIEDLMELAEDAEIAGNAAVYMSKKTMGLIFKCESVRNALFPNMGTSVPPPIKTARSIIYENYGLRIVPIDASMPVTSYLQQQSGKVQFVPDFKVSIASEGVLGDTRFGTTPEEADVRFGVKDADVKIIDAGIAITTKTVDRGNVEIDTKVSMIALPVIENIEELRTLDVK